MKEDFQNVKSFKQFCEINDKQHICKTHSADLETYLK